MFGAAVPADLENRLSHGEQFFRSDERRRIALELEDKTRQPLAMLKLELGLLKRLDLGKAKALIEQCEEAIEEIRRQIGALGD